MSTIVKITSGKNYAKFRNHYNKVNFTLSGIANQLKTFASGSNSSVVNFESIIKGSKINKSNLTAKNLSYFLKIEICNNSEFTLKQFETVLDDMNNYLLNGFKLNKINCRLYQIKKDTKRLQTKFEKLTKSIEKNKIDIDSFQLTPNDMQSYLELNSLHTELKNNEDKLTKVNEYLVVLSEKLDYYIKQSNKQHENNK